MAYLARKNLVRRKFRTSIILIALALMVGTLFATLLFSQGVSYGVQNGTQRLGADLLVVPVGAQEDANNYLLSGQPEQFYMNSSVLQEIQALPDVAQASPQLFLTSVSNISSSSTGQLEVVGIDPSTDFTILPWLTTPLSSPMTDGEAVTGSGITSAVGSASTQFFGQSFSVAGQLNPTGLGLDNSLFITITEAEHIIQLNNEGQLPTKLPISILPGEISDVAVKLKPGVDLNYGAEEISIAVPGVQVITTSEMTSTVQGELSGLLASIYVAGGAVWGVSLIMIGAVFSMSVNERRREIGLMRSLGSTSRFIYGLITLEGTLQTVVGGVIGLGVGAFAIYLFNGVLAKAAQLIFVWPSSSQIVVLVLECLAIAVAIGAVASAYPAYASSRMEPYAAVRQE